MEDSLDNWSSQVPQRKSVSPSIKEQKDKALLQQLKQKFVTSLSKLQSSQTREISMREIRILIDKNREPEHIRMFMSLMRTLKREGTSSSTKQHQILVFSFMAEILKENLVDPIDKPSPSRIKTCFKIVETLHGYFTETSGTVQQACARVIIDLGKHVLGFESQNSTLDTDTYLAVVWAPLISILKNGVDKASQSTASVCLNELVQYWRVNAGPFPRYQQVLQKIVESGDLLSVVLRLNCEYSQVFMALNTLIELWGLTFFAGKLLPFVNKILGVINKIGNPSKQDNSSNLNAYMCKVYVCEIFEQIGALVRDKPDVKASLDALDVREALEKTARNRVLQVQTAATRAIKTWNGEVLKPKDYWQSSASKAEGKAPLMSLAEARKNKKKSRSNSKEGKVELEKELNHIQEDLNKLVKGGWGAHNRANKFVKKNSGVGGGYNLKMDELDRSNSKSPGKSHKEHLQELRKFIKDSSKQHSNKDKFAMCEQRESEARRPISPGMAEARKQQQVASQKYNYNVKSNNKQQSADFELMEDGGDQMTYLGKVKANNLKGNDKRGAMKAEQPSQAPLKQEWIMVDSKALQGFHGDDDNTLGAESSLMDQEEMKQLLKEEEQVMREAQNREADRGTGMGKKPNPYDQMTFNKKQSPQAPTKAGTKSIGPSVKNNSLKKVDESQGNGFLLAGMELDLQGFDPMAESVADSDILSESDFKGQEWNPFQNRNKTQGKPQNRNLQDSVSSKGRTKQQPKNTSSLNQSETMLNKNGDSLTLSDSDKGRSKGYAGTQPVKGNTGTDTSKVNAGTDSMLNAQTSKFNSFNQQSQIEEEEEILDESKYEESYQMMQHKNKINQPPTQLGTRPQTVTYKEERSQKGYEEGRPRGQVRGRTSVPERIEEEEEYRYPSQQPKPQSFPKVDLLPQRVQDFYAFSVKQGEEIAKRVKPAPVEDVQAENYQQLIKNPPRSQVPHRLDKVSELDPSPPEAEEQKPSVNIIEQWKEVLELVENNELNEAYILALEMDDPLYLMRLMLMTDTPLGKLTPAVSCKLWQKFLQIYEHRFIDNIFVQMFSNFNQMSGGNTGRGIRRALTIQQVNDLLVQLFEVSGRTKGKLSYSAATLYNNIEGSLNSNN